MIDGDHDQRRVQEFRHRVIQASKALEVAKDHLFHVAWRAGIRHCWHYGRVPRPRVFRHASGSGRDNNSIMYRSVSIGLVSWKARKRSPRRDRQDQGLLSTKGAQVNNEERRNEAPTSRPVVTLARFGRREDPVQAQVRDLLNFSFHVNAILQVASPNNLYLSICTSLYRDDS